MLILKVENDNHIDEDNKSTTTIKMMVVNVGGEKNLETNSTLTSVEQTKATNSKHCYGIIHSHCK